MGLCQSLYWLTIDEQSRDEQSRDVHGLDSSMDWIALDWIGSNSGECCVDWIGLGPMTVMYKIMAAYVFQRNRPRLFYVIISDFLRT